ncbi:MAG: ATP-binding protein, partial [Sutterella wadsworthensis]|nr:ATP-binding protein [Sutterella wadsworthensis]
MAQEQKVPKRIARTVLNALKGGVVPRIGLPYIAVGRKKEIDALLSDIEIVSEGGASVRFITGRYGSGKSFLLQTIRAYAMDRGFVVADADLSPERRLQGTKGQGLATYKELMQNLATKTMPEGGALTLILERWMSAIRAGLAEENIPPGNPAYLAQGESRILAQIAKLGEVVHGYEFSALLVRYFRAMTAGEDEVRANIVKWLRGEYATRADAKRDLGVNLIVTDDNWYDFVKIFALFLRGAGYSGLLVLIDELVNLYKIPNSISRQYNYEKVLTIYNDALQGRARYLGILMGGTPQAVEDQRRGLFSYEALRSRLASGRFSEEGRQDLMSPVIRLEPLT